MNWWLWALYYPALKFLSLFVFWVPKFRERKNFEDRNHSDLLSRTFREIGQIADLCFEFSSEGEYQQVASLIEDALKMGKRIELVFFSPSVEKTIINLAQSYPDQIRYFRFPLVTFNPWKKNGAFIRWITSKRLTLVRYDLFPEFLAWSQIKGHELVMLSVTFKKERLKNKSIPLMKRLFLSKASRIFYASLPDQEWGIQHQFPAPYFDFRAEQIKRRIQQKEDKFLRHLPEYRQLKTLSDQYPSSKRLLFGNAWPSDLFLLEQLPSDVFVLVIPHKLGPAIINEFIEAFKKWGRTAVELTGQPEFPKSNTYILNRKGVLCELYADFDFAYVGGGYEAGVHSLLEPLVAGSASIACGKLHQRSTEFDMALSLNKVTEVKDASDFKSWLMKTDLELSSMKLNDLFEKYEKYKRDIILC